jgi:hypothetical protein
VTKELGYDETAANRRITAARLSRQIPEIENKVAEGKLSLSNLVQDQIFFNKETKLKNQKISVDQKREILNLLENKSKREAEKVLLAKSPEQVTLKESTRQITEEHVELRILIDNDLMHALEKIRSLISHKNPNPTYLELLKEMAKIALERLDPAAKPVKSKAEQTLLSAPVPDSKSPAPAPEAGRCEPPDVKRYVSVATERKIWQKTGGKCTFVSSETGKQCGSTYQVEVHHIVPYAMGGPTTEANLTLLCHKHNILEAIRDYGARKMDPYLR